LAFVYTTWACAGTILMTLVSLMVSKQPLDSAGALGISIMLIGTVILNGFSTPPSTQRGSAAIAAQISTHALADQLLRLKP